AVKPLLPQPPQILPKPTAPAPTVKPQTVTAQWTTPTIPPTVAPAGTKTSSAVPPVVNPAKEATTDKPAPALEPKEDANAAPISVSETPLVSETAAAPETETEPPLFGQVTAETGPRRFLIPMVLVGIVIVAAIAGGVWW